MKFKQWINEISFMTSAEKFIRRNPDIADLVEKLSATDFDVVSYINNAINKGISSDLIKAKLDAEMQMRDPSQFKGDKSAWAQMPMSDEILGSGEYHR